MSNDRAWERIVQFTVVTFYGQVNDTPVKLHWVQGDSFEHISEFLIENSLTVRNPATCPFHSYHATPPAPPPQKKKPKNMYFYYLALVVW